MARCLATRSSGLLQLGPQSVCSSHADLWDQLLRRNPAFTPSSMTTSKKLQRTTFLPNHPLSCPRCDSLQLEGLSRPQRMSSPRVSGSLTWRPIKCEMDHADR